MRFSISFINWLWFVKFYMIMWVVGMLVTSQGWAHGEEARATLTSKKVIICPCPLPYDVPPTFSRKRSIKLIFKYKVSLNSFTMGVFQNMWTIIVVKINGWVAQTCHYCYYCYYYTYQCFVWMPCFIQVMLWNRNGECHFGYYNKMNKHTLILTK